MLSNVEIKGVFICVFPIYRGRFFFFFFPERRGLTCDMTTLWNIFFSPVAYLARRAEDCVLKPGIKTLLEVREELAN